MDDYRAFTVRVCRECGLPVHAEDCRFTGPLTDAPGDEVEVVRADAYRGAVDALLAAPMPERESIHKGDEWAERYGDWWHEHVRPHVIGGR